MAAVTYTFDDAVDMSQVEDTLAISVLAIESMYGAASVRLEIACELDPERRTCVIDSGTEASRTLNQIFVGYLRREFGDNAFRVGRGDPTASAA
jgi:hypothetical protein